MSTPESTIANSEADYVRLSNCRLLIAWFDDPMSVEAAAEANHCLRRILVVQKPGEERVAYRSPKIRLLPLTTEDDIEAVLRHALEDNFIYLAEGKVDVFLAPARRRLYPELCRTIERSVLWHMRATLSFVALRATRGWHMLMNTWLNLPRAVTEATIADLRNRGAGQPAIIVGAGPSLDQDVAELAMNHTKALVIACDGAWSTLAQADIVPDLVVAVDDSERVWRHCVGLGIRQKDVPMACLLQTAWPVARYHHGPIYWGGMGKIMDRIIAGELHAMPVFDTGQCVGHAALEVAALLGASRIIMVGFDLCFDGERRHPRQHAVPYYNDQPPPLAQQTTIAGNDGTPKATDWTLLMYLREFERRIARLNVPVFNATRRGARIAGAKGVDLSNTLASLPSMQKPLLRGRDVTPEAVCRCRVFKETWRQSFTRVSEQSLKTLAETAPPARFGPDPFPGLDPGHRTVDVLTEIEHPAMIAEFRLAWEDWLRHGAPMDEDGQRISALGKRTLDLLDNDSKLFATLLSGGDAGLDQRFATCRALAIAGTEQPDCEWNRFLNQWLMAGWKVDEWTGAADAAAGIWSYIQRHSISVVLSFEGSVFPAIWAVPFCGCADLRLHPPSGTPLREAWLPGYMVITVDAHVADTWRQVVPKDRPVMLVQPDSVDMTPRNTLLAMATFMQQDLNGRGKHAS